MKINIPNIWRQLGATALMLVTVGWFTTAGAAEKMKPMKGGEHQLMLSGISTQGQADELKAGDAMAMVCAKCKTVDVTYVTQDSKHKTKVIVGEKHGCPGCGGTITVVGHGKNKTEVRTHTCSKCGDDSAFCCATKPGAGTKGMEKK